MPYTDLEKKRKQCREWMKAHPEKRKAWYDAWRAKNKDKIRGYWLKHNKKNRIKYNYKITLEEYQQVISDPCAICGSYVKERVLDHCHQTEKIRGALCHSCNVKLGWYEKRQEVILNYLKYGGRK